MDSESHENAKSTVRTLKVYEPPKLTYVGRVVDIVQSGGGKLSTNAPDGPDVRKPPGR